MTRHATLSCELDCVWPRIRYLDARCTALEAARHFCLVCFAKGHWHYRMVAVSTNYQQQDIALMGIKTVFLYWKLACRYLAGQIALWDLNWTENIYAAAKVCPVYREFYQRFFQSGCRPTGCCIR